jgi:hypothetical protein
MESKKSSGEGGGRQGGRVPRMIHGNMVTFNVVSAHRASSSA